MDDLPNNMTNATASASTFGMGGRHVPMPPRQGARAFTQSRPIGIGLLPTGGTLDMNFLPRRNFLTLAGAPLAIAALPHPASVLDYPTRPPKIAST
jgi:hypothetical protein